MTPRYVGSAVGGLLIAHNVLRVVASSRGAGSGIFNYLKPMGWNSSSLTAGPIPLWPMALFAAVAAIAVRQCWRTSPRVLPAAFSPALSGPRWSLQSQQF